MLPLFYICIVIEKVRHEMGSRQRLRLNSPPGASSSKIFRLVVYVYPFCVDICIYIVQVLQFMRTNISTSKGRQLVGV